MAEAQSKRRGFLKGAFNMAVGFGVGIGVKAAAVCLFPPVLAVFAAASGIGAANAALARVHDVRAHNKNKKPEDRAGFFELTKTGHSRTHYAKKAGLSGALSLAGGLIGMGVAQHWFHGPAIHAASTASAPVTAPPPVVITPPPVHIPTPEENLAGLLTDVKANLPAHHCAGIDTALHRMESVNDAVRAQAVKDMGYFYANGFCGVAKNSPLADRLFESALTISHGHNMQATHDLGYQLLHGIGTAADHNRAWELLNRSADSGHRLSKPLVEYMKFRNLGPIP